MKEAAAKALAINPNLIFAQALFNDASGASHLSVWESYERVFREQPNYPDNLSLLCWYKAVAGYLQEHLDINERRVVLEPLSVEAAQDFGFALFAVGRASEAVDAWALSARLTPDDSTNLIGDVYLLENRDEAAISDYETALKIWGYPDSIWVRDLVTGARDPANGQAYLDRRIPEIIDGMPKRFRTNWRRGLYLWYLFFGYLDRYYELMLDDQHYEYIDEWVGEGSMWPDPDLYMFAFDGLIYRGRDFVAHPKYLELGQSMGLIEVWEMHGPPDFCDKVDGNWVCK